MARITDEDTDELPLDTRTRTRTKVDPFRRKINYDRAASIIAEMASYSDLLFKQHIGEKDGIRKVDRWEDFELFNELFAEHDSNAPNDDERYANDLVVIFEDGQCVIYVHGRVATLIDWTTFKRMIYALHQHCNAKAHDDASYAELVEKAYESGAIGQKLRNAMEREIRTCK